MSLLQVLFLFSLVHFFCQASPVPAATDEDVDRCYNNLVQKLRTLNGGFITQSQGVQMTGICFDMYLVQNKTLEEITDYMRNNINNFGFSPDQINIMTDVYNNIAQELGSETMANQIFKKSLNVARSFAEYSQTANVSNGLFFL
ncbi:hypothetical protein DdX_11680 [Ditylenchus destructor]|uniref:Secreted protein n=1 Tax=Ditylenchus destructor TaxID=166010 RepID=A0AAD4R4H5_9BILA|nr:hypothetical protein DdX_11680 [Ditylenchus destructor]